MKRIAFLFFLLAGAGPVQAQAALDGCVDREDRPVRRIVRNDMSWAGVATVENGESVIYWNQRLMGPRSRTTQIFVYLHECGHHLLGHVWKTNDARWEQEADCWAVQLMWEGGMIAGRHLRVLEEELSRTRGDAIHLGGEALLEALRGCLSIKTDRRAWAASLAKLIDGAADSFASLRGQGVPTPSARTGIHESLVDLPGTYDCEVTHDPAVRCRIFAAREGGRVSDRFDELARIVPAALPASWASRESREKSGAAVRTLAAEDTAAGLSLTIVATPAHRILFSLELLPGAPLADSLPPLALDPVGFRTEPPVGTEEVTAAAPDTTSPSARPRKRGPFVLRQGMLVRIQVPTLRRGWVRAKAARTASATPCILFELDIETRDGQKRYAMLAGVTAMEVDARMWDGPIFNLQPEGAQWVTVPLEEVRRQDGGCRR